MLSRFSAYLNFSWVVVILFTSVKKITNMRYLWYSPEQDGGAGVLEALSKLLGPIGFFMIILLCVGVCIVYHNAK